MLWETLDRLPSGDLTGRAGSLKNLLPKLSDEEVKLFQQDATRAIRGIFNESSYYVYCAVFDGWANETGFYDFCSNVTLSGFANWTALANRLPQFAEIKDLEEFSEDYGLSIADIGIAILQKRLGADQVSKLIQQNEIASIEGVWDELRRKVGDLLFRPNWDYIEKHFPALLNR